MMRSDVGLACALTDRAAAGFVCERDLGYPADRETGLELATVRLIGLPGRAKGISNDYNVGGFA